MAAARCWRAPGTGLAAERGYEFLRVGTTELRPILQKLGLYAVTTTTPYEWTP